MRWLAAILLLSGCTAPYVENGRDQSGQRQPAYVFQQPLCALFCFSTLATTGSDVSTIGAGASGSSTQTQNVSQQGNLK